MLSANPSSLELSSVTFQSDDLSQPTPLPRHPQYLGERDQLSFHQPKALRSVKFMASSRDSLLEKEDPYHVMSEYILCVDIASKREDSGDCHRNRRKTHPECEERRSSKKNEADRE